MPRREPLHTGEAYHVYNRGANRGAIFFGEDNYLFFLQRLREKVASSATVLAYCLMPNHYHLLLRITSDLFSKDMQAFGTSYSKAINAQEDRSGSLFQGRFQTRHVPTSEDCLNLSRYIHRNPVALVRSLRDWTFSSYPDYLGLRDGTLPDKAAILGEFGGVEAYERFVENSQDNALLDGLTFDET